MLMIKKIKKNFLDKILYINQKIMWNTDIIVGGKTGNF